VAESLVRWERFRADALGTWFRGALWRHRSEDRVIRIAVDDLERIGDLHPHGIRIELRSGKPQQRAIRDVEQAHVFVELRFQFGLGEVFMVDVHGRIVA